MKRLASTLTSSVAAAMALLASIAPAQTLSNDALVKALQHGGYVIVMRHASSPREVPDLKTANPDNVTRERQLDQAGRDSAIAMGAALHKLNIPIAEVLSSPTYRAQETIRLAQLPKPKTVPELGENGQSMQGTTDAQSAWLQKKVTEFPKGTNTLLVTHFPNMTKAFPQWTSNLADGEALIFGPDAQGGATMIARLKIEDWPKLQP